MLILRVWYSGIVCIPLSACVVMYGVYRYVVRDSKPMHVQHKAIQLRKVFDTYTINQEIHVAIKSLLFYCQ